MYKNKMVETGRESSYPRYTSHEIPHQLIVGHQYVDMRDNHPNIINDQKDKNSFEGDNVELYHQKFNSISKDVKGSDGDQQHFSSGNQVDYEGRNDNHVYHPRDLSKPAERSVFSNPTESKTSCDASVISALTFDESQMEMDAFEQAANKSVNTMNSQKKLIQESKENIDLLSSPTNSHPLKKHNLLATTEENDPLIIDSPSNNTKCSRNIFSTRKQMSPKSGRKQSAPLTSFSKRYNNNNNIHAIPPRTNRGHMVPGTQPINHIHRRVHSLSAVLDVHPSESIFQSSTPNSPVSMFSPEDKTLRGQMNRFTPSKKRLHRRGHSNTSMGSIASGVLTSTHGPSSPVSGVFSREDKKLLGQRNRFTPLKKQLHRRAHSSTSMGSIASGMLPPTHVPNHPTASEYSREDKTRSGQRNRFTPLKKRSHRRGHSNTSSMGSHTSGMLTSTTMTLTSGSNNDSHDIYLESDDASASIIQSYNQSERRKIKNVMKKEIKYFMGNIVPKSLKVDSDTEVDLQRSSGYLT